MTDILRPRADPAAPPGEGEAAPFDLAHLDRQTFGDDALRIEVLALFAKQIETVHARLAAAGEDERRAAAHTLKGAALGVGAFAIAERAGRIETEPADAGALDGLRPLIDEALGFIASIGR